jgi:hypothetical protein
MARPWTEVEGEIKAGGYTIPQCQLQRSLTRQIFDQVPESTLFNPTLAVTAVVLFLEQCKVCQLNTSKMLNSSQL